MSSKTTTCVQTAAIASPVNVVRRIRARRREVDSAFDAESAAPEALAMARCGSKEGFALKKRYLVVHSHGDDNDLERHPGHQW